MTDITWFPAYSANRGVGRHFLAKLLASTQRAAHPTGSAGSMPLGEGSNEARSHIVLPPVLPELLFIRSRWRK